MHLWPTRHRFLALACILAIGTSCQRQGLDSPKGGENAPTAGPTQKPSPPLQLAEPTMPTAMVSGADLTKLEGRTLLGHAARAAAQGNYKDAVAFQYWAAQKTGNDRYNLACYYARTNAVDAAFYWLQQTALEEGLDAEHAGVDEDLEALRRDGRWSRVRQFLNDCGRYWQQSGIQKTALVLPEGYKKDKPVPVVIWLHGLGSRPDDFVDDDLQNLADEMNAAFLGVSGTLPRGPRSFVWSEDPVRDARRITEALKEVSDKLQPGPVVLIGFSQGAQVGLEVAARHPDHFAGAIVMSPGTRGPVRLKEVKASPTLARRGFVVVCGAKEHPGNVAQAAEDARWLKGAGAQVIHKPYPDLATHSFPPDFAERLPEWVRFIEKANAP